MKCTLVLAFILNILLFSFLMLGFYKYCGFVTGLDSASPSFQRVMYLCMPRHLNFQPLSHHLDLEEYHRQVWSFMNSCTTVNFSCATTIINPNVLATYDFTQVRVQSSTAPLGVFVPAPMGVFVPAPMGVFVPTPMGVFVPAPMGVLVPVLSDVFVSVQVGLFIFISIDVILSTQMGWVSSDELDLNFPTHIDVNISIKEVDMNIHIQKHIKSIALIDAKFLHHMSLTFIAHSLHFIHNRPTDSMYSVILKWYGEHANQVTCDHVLSLIPNLCIPSVPQYHEFLHLKFKNIQLFTQEHIYCFGIEIHNLHFQSLHFLQGLVMFIQCVCLYVFSYYMCKIQWLQTNMFIRLNHEKYFFPFLDFKCHSDVSLLHIVGGGSSCFSIQDFKDYGITDNIEHFGVLFKFKDYILQPHPSDCKTLKDIPACVIPVHLMIPRLTVMQLKKVAVCHGIYCHSKMIRADILNALSDHMCIDCQTYITTFDVVDSGIKAERKKFINLLAVRRYQAKNPQHKKGHISAVKRLQKKHKKASNAVDLTVKRAHVQLGDKYKLTNLLAARRYHEKKKSKYITNLVWDQDITNMPQFPPSSPSSELEYTIISDACRDMSPNAFTESGCAVCGGLTPMINLIALSEANVNLNILRRKRVTRQERFSLLDHVKSIKGPVLVRCLNNMCITCHTSLVKGKVPLLALANGKWIGSIPKQLSDLSFAEQLLIARIRHNRCIVRVSSGMHKMRANAILFANPTPKVYDILPPPIEEIDEVLAFIYTGPCKPTKSDFERTPLLVRRNRVRAALDWLKLNHSDYYDLEISQRNLENYPEDVPPVVVDYRQSFSNKETESTAIYDNEDEDGTETGKCPFVVHGLTGEEYSTKSIKALKAVALSHLTSNGKILAVGHSEEPASIYDNPQLFPQMMPWLFPYGLGGIGNDLHQGRLSELAHKRHLLMYHDKRFQKDPYFPLIAFNHEQIKQGTTGGYLLAEKSIFEDISKRLVDIDTTALDDLARRMEDGERIVPETDEERQCFQLLKDLDHVGGHVKGSITSKKYMRNEIWSLISFLGAPSWFITFSPADNKHPISLYYADMKEVFEPELKDYDERYRLIAHNPVAGARFFHFICEMFILHVLGVGTNHRGIFGETAGFYGTVEQQGRLTLHMHMLLWIIGILSPQEIRDKVMDPNSNFQKRLVEYLESVHVGEFLTGTMDEVKAELKSNQGHMDYKDPTQTLPEAPPPKCDIHDDECNECQRLDNWWDRFRHTVDDLIFRSNVHDCKRNLTSHYKPQNKDRPSCINKHGNCKARFPRPIFDHTEVDPKTGALNMKKGESLINTITPLITFLLRCNTDITSLLSGTAIKAVVAYISDYVTKPGLKTYVIFNTITAVFRRNSEMLGGSMKRKEKARSLVIKVVNALTAKMEIGGPMASLYLLGNPDHYTSHNFNPVYWKGYVSEVAKAWTSCEDTKIDDFPEKLVIHKTKYGYVGCSSVYDYIYRPNVYSNKTLFEWVQMSERKFKPFKKVKAEDKPDADELYGGEASEEDSSGESSKGESSVDDLFNEKLCDERLFDRNSSDGDSSSELNTLSNSQSEYSAFVHDSDSEEDKPDNQVDDYEFDCNYSNNKEIEIDDEDIAAVEECNYKRFLNEHPLYDSHVVYFDERQCNTVPNFVGGTLPRRDRGDREYYCMTMLTLFKPWRNGKDLKNIKSWDETFTKHKFSARQQQLMDNFNLRYECNDARDDFSAQVKKDNTTGGIFSQILSASIIDDLDESNCGDDFGDDTGSYDEDYGVNKYSMPGPHGLKMQAQMDAAKNYVTAAGWLDESPDGFNLIDKSQIKPQLLLSGKEWKIQIQDKRAELIAEKSKHLLSVKRKVDSNRHHNDPNTFEVAIVDQSYLRKTFRSESEEAQRCVDHFAHSFNLNIEQERAFRIVANHSITSYCEQLKMYLGGMGGTGKSQVIKALICLFKERNEAHQFVVLAPTGTAAALLGGSTYHSFLGIQGGDRTQVQNSSVTVGLIKSRLEGVDYIFLDEVSMLSCHDMYRISSQLAKALNIHDMPFGGINMIFAGDFAQLPPVAAYPLYSNIVGTQAHSGLTVMQQETAIGKALWHQVTTVVILRENMRQKSQTAEDASLRTALVNMRYGACTLEDIKFLRSRICGRCPEQPKVSSKQFRNVAVICGIHTHKDMINQLGCKRFADETGQRLTNFYSIDKWGKQTDPAFKKKWGKSKAASDLKHKSGEVEFDDQLEIWKLSHGATEHFPGKLSLCVGMPVIIKYNYATELCITNGQEGFVAGWQSTRGSHGKRVLDTLFVRLNEPPQLVQIHGLPDNVVPITKSKKSVQCAFPSGLKEFIEREQVWILPNFAMTAHASEGKTRPYNVVHLNSCREHMAYYTALSRSASAAGTIIIQGFDPFVIQKGCTGYLRQEFRELELLDDITRLKYEDNIPEQVDGCLRNTLIRQFQVWKGIDYVPSQTDSPLKWSAKDPLNFLSAIADSPWKLVAKYKKETDSISNSKVTSAFVKAQGSQGITHVNIYSHDKFMKESLFKKDKKTLTSSDTLNYIGPAGILWDGNNYSCAYDSLLVILYDIWIQDPKIWTQYFRALGNDHIKAVVAGFRNFYNHNLSLENVRDDLRQELHAKDPVAYPLGHAGASVARLASELLRVNRLITSSQDICTNCDFEGPVEEHHLGLMLSFGHFRSDVNSTSKLVNNLGHDSENSCPECMCDMTTEIFYNIPPKLLVIEYSANHIKTNHRISLEDDAGPVYLYLRGIIYHGMFHFTSRIISEDRTIWFHDGRITGNVCHLNGCLETISDKGLQKCQQRTMVLVVYAQQ